MNKNIFETIDMIGLHIKKRISRLAAKSDVVGTITQIPCDDLKNYHSQLVLSREFEKKWRKLLKDYTMIYVHKLQNDSIGETFPRFFNMLDDKKEWEEKKELHIIIPVPDWGYNGPVFNQRMLDIFSRYLHLVHSGNVEFWEYVFKNHRAEINVKEYLKFQYRRAGLYHVVYGNPMLHLNDSEIKEARQKMARLPIQKEYVCVHARDSECKRTNFKDFTAAISSSLRNCDINSFELAAQYLKEHDIQLVRMGKYEKSPCNLTNCIDYAGRFYDELLDFYLLLNCKFVLGCDSGLTSIAPHFGKTILLTNMTDLTCSYESLALTCNDIYLPKKYWSIKKGRYLKLKEVLDVNNRAYGNLLEYERMGIRLVDNTAEEILDATDEVLLRIDGKWEDTQEDMVLRQEYDKILSDWKTDHKKPLPLKDQKRMPGEYNMVPFLISTKYLRNNQYLVQKNGLQAEDMR